MEGTYVYLCLNEYTSVGVFTEKFIVKSANMVDGKNEFLYNMRLNNT